MKSKWVRRLPFLTAGWTGIYGAVHIWWALDEPPEFGDFPTESLVPGAWTPVVLAAAATLGALLIGTGIGAERSDRRRWLLAVLGWVAGAGLILYSFMFALNVAGALFSVLFGEGFHPVGLLVRGSGVVGGILTVLIAVAEQRRARRACMRCGRVHGRTAEDRTAPSPWWAYAGAYAAIAGCLARYGAQAVTGVEGLSLAGPQTVAFFVFAGLMLIAGTLLPLALAHRWGRIWPRWVLPLAGRKVPRWIVLAPAFFVGGGLAGYFGIGGLAALPQNKFDVDYPLWWSLMVFPGYVVWGVGLLIAATSYAILTKPECSRRALPLAT